MNVALQFLLHVSELTVYFLSQYPNDKNNLNEKNKLNKSHGQISNSFYELVKGVCEAEYKKKKNLTLSKLHNSVNTIIYSGSQKDFEKIETSFSPNNFKKTLGGINTQFQNFEANNFKGLILYLIQTIHKELNYFGGNPSSNLFQPNQYDKDDTFLEFMNSYNSHNSSTISNIFYGTYEIITLCHKCYKPLYNYKKFEIIIFDMLDYKIKYLIFIMDLKIIRNLNN